LLFLGASLSRYPLEGYREKCVTRTVLGTRFAKKSIVLDIPITIAGMSFGALSANVKEALGQAATAAGTSTTTGDGGMTQEERRTSAGFCHHCHTGKCPVGVTTQDTLLEQRVQPEEGSRRVRNYLKTLKMELTTIARACGKQNVHHLEPEDLVALTVKAAAMARVPLAGISWIPGLT
jgi:glutamate synthase domain-containing protein 2